MARTGKQPRRAKRWQRAPREPWRILPGESARAYAAFSAYRDMGPERSQQSCRRLSAEPGFARVVVTPAPLAGALPRV